MEEKLNDPVIDEIREVRRSISARFNHQPEKLVQHYMELQKQYEGRLVDFSGVDKSPTSSVAE